MKTFTVHWQTRRSPGATFYRGAETVRAENSEAAKTLVQYTVHSRAFREYALTHIIITKTEQR